MNRWTLAVCLLLGSGVLTACGPTAGPVAAPPATAATQDSPSPAAAPKPSPSRAINWLEVAKGTILPPEDADPQWLHMSQDENVPQPKLTACGRETLKAADKPVAWLREWQIGNGLGDQEMYALPDVASVMRILATAAKADAGCRSYTVKAPRELFTTVPVVKVLLNEDVPNGSLHCYKDNFLTLPVSYTCTATYGYGHLIGRVTGKAATPEEASRIMHDLLYAGIQHFNLMARASS